MKLQHDGRNEGSSWGSKARRVEQRSRLLLVVALMALVALIFTPPAAADYCGWPEAGGSTSAYLAINPELSGACRYAAIMQAELPDSTVLAQPANGERVFEHGLAEELATQKDAAMQLASEMSVLRHGQAEHLAAQKEARLAQRTKEAETARLVQASGEDSALERAQQAEAARYTGLAEAYAEESALQRARAAEAARYTGLAEAYAGDSVLERAQRAEAARYTGLAESYAEESALQRARAAEAARYTGLARMYQLQERIALTDQK